MSLTINDFLFAQLLPPNANNVNTKLQARPEQEVRDADPVGEMTNDEIDRMTKWHANANAPIRHWDIRSFVISASERPIHAKYGVMPGASDRVTPPKPSGASQPQVEVLLVIAVEQVLDAPVNVKSCV